MQGQSEKEHREKTLRFSTLDGVFATLTTSFTQDYITPFLLLLGGGARHVGALSALSNFVSSVVQLKSASASERLGSRKRVITLFVLFQALMLPLMFGAYWLGSFGAAAFIAAVTLFTAFGAFAAPVWGSLMADLVEEDRRGDYFGWRGKVFGLVSIPAVFAAGFILHWLERYTVLAGFAVIFLLAFAFRLISWHYLGRMHEPTVPVAKEDRFTLLDFLARMKRSNFGRFVLFVSFFKFAVNVASPFFAVMMISDLKFDYLTYTLITLSMTLAANLTIRRWGAHADRVGNLKVIRLTSRIAAVVPFLWLINQHPAYLFFCQAVAGFAWAGFNLSANNFIYDAVTPGKRTRCIAYFNAISGVALCLGSLAGGLLATRIPGGFFAFGIMNVILISGVLRLAVTFLAPFKLKEVREVEKIRSHELFLSVLRLKPAYRGYRAS